MARGPYSKENVLAARQFLAGMPEFKEHSKLGAYGINETQAVRIANAFAKQQALGVTPSYEAARGHIETPEHPGRRAPRLAEPAINYRPPAPLGAATAGIPYGVGGELFREVPGREAMQIIHYLARDSSWGEWGAPLVIQARDEATNKVYYAFENYHGVKVAGQWTGIDAGFLLKELRENGMTLEQYVLNALSNSKSGPGLNVAALSTFQITALSHG